MPKNRVRPGAAAAIWRSTTRAGRLETISAHWHIQSTRGRQLNGDMRQFGQARAPAKHAWGSRGNIVLDADIDHICDTFRLVLGQPSCDWGRLLLSSTCEIGLPKRGPLLTAVRARRLSCAALDSICRLLNMPMPCPIVPAGCPIDTGRYDRRGADSDEPSAEPRFGIFDAFDVSLVALSDRRVPCDGRGDLWEAPRHLKPSPAPFSPAGKPAPRDRFSAKKALSRVRRCASPRRVQWRFAPHDGLAIAGDRPCDSEGDRP